MEKKDGLWVHPYNTADALIAIYQPWEVNAMLMQ